MIPVAHNIQYIFYTVPELVRYVLIFLSSFIEGVPVIGSLFPGGTITILVGSLSESGFIWPPLAILLIAVGTFCGDLIGFVAGKHLKHHRLIKNFIESEKSQKGWDIFDRHVAILIIFGKIIPIVRSTPSIFAAMRGITFKRYVLYSALGSIVWSITGVYGGNILARLVGGTTAIIVIFVIFVFSVLGFAYNRLKKKKE